MKDRILIAFSLVLLVLGIICIFIVANPIGFHVWQTQTSQALGEAVHEVWIGFLMLCGIATFFAIVWGSIFLHKQWTHRGVHVVHPTKHGNAQAVVINNEMHTLQGPDIDYLLDMMQKTQKLVSGRTMVKEIEGTVEPKLLSPPVPHLPEIVRYEDVRRYVPSGHALLGVDEQGEVETCDFEKLMTCWIVGGSSTGKSNTVALKVDEAMRMGHNLRLLVIDPHAKKEDSLYNRIKAYESLFLRPVAYKPEQVHDALTWFLSEFNRRLDTGDCSYDILLVVDEVSNVIEMENPYAQTKDELKDIFKLLKRIATICGQEARGFGMFGWFISQKAAGLAWLRNVVITVIAHKMNMMNERMLACNQKTDIANDMETWPKGRVVVYGLGFEEVRVLQQPIFTTPRHIENVSLLEDLQPKPTSHLYGRPYLVEVDTEGEHEVAIEADMKRREGVNAQNSLSEREKRIGEMFFGEQRMSPNAIAKELWPEVKGGDAYQKNAAIVADAIRKCAAMRMGA